MIIDLSEVKAFAEKIAVAGEKLVDDAKSTTVRAGTKIRDEARANAPRGAAKQYPRTIVRRSKQFAAGVEVEVEAGGVGQGKLGSVLEFGSPTSPAYPHVTPSFEGEVPVWFGFVDQAANGFLR